jgi:diguanylate cyclase (GGDEF)-like protein/PAS domain S-box-containing protein
MGDVRVRPSSQSPDDQGPDATGGAPNGQRHERDVQPFTNPTARALRVSEARFRELCATIPVGVALCDLAGRFIEVNAALAGMLERSATDLVGKSIHELFHPDDAGHLARAYEELAEQDGPQRVQERRRLVRSSGEEAWANLSMSILRDIDGAPATLLTTVQDISELHLLQERFQHQALHDVLTGLPNRQFFATRLEAALQNLPRDAEVAVYHLALDGFEVVNEGLGYQAGDVLVRSVARRLEKLIEGEEAMAARFGGTEFGILLRQTPETPGVAQFAALINEELAEPIYVDDHGIATSASIGVVRRSVAEGSPQSMMRAAEVALRRAKAAGKRQWAMFDSDRDPHERVESRLAAIIPGALEMGELTLTYRPVADLVEDRIVGLQAQLRWEPFGHAPLGHAKCLDLGERTGVTLCLRDWMLRTIGEQITGWHRADSWPNVQLDFSPHQSTDPDLVAAVRRVLTDHEDDLGWLWVSFPMRVLMAEFDDARDNVEVLGSMGLRTAVHDFRGSPEELRRLRSVPVTAVRLAPELVELVQESPAEPEAQAVVRMLPLVRSCDRSLVVDGIGTAEQAQWWRSMGCKIGIGSHYGELVSECDVPVIHPS